ncbi:MAG: hypothetical protein M1826_003538 [Phylliscum demangeonii]|nr:MAG: hypothetical protein M1826_003538 [Phylliscum demangeonii]
MSFLNSVLESIPGYSPELLLSIQEDDRDRRDFGADILKPGNEEARQKAREARIAGATTSAAKLRAVRAARKRNAEVDIGSSMAKAGRTGAMTNVHGSSRIVTTTSGEKVDASKSGLKGSGEKSAPSSTKSTTTTQYQPTATAKNATMNSSPATKPASNLLKRTAEQNIDQSAVKTARTGPKAAGTSETASKASSATKTPGHAVGQTTATTSPAKRITKTADTSSAMHLAPPARARTPPTLTFWDHAARQELSKAYSHLKKGSFAEIMARGKANLEMGYDCTSVSNSIFLAEFDLDADQAKIDSIKDKKERRLLKSQTRAKEQRSKQIVANFRVAAKLAGRPDPFPPSKSPPSRVKRTATAATHWAVAKPTTQRVFQPVDRATKPAAIDAQKGAKKAQEEAQANTPKDVQKDAKKSTTDAPSHSTKPAKKAAKGKKTEEPKRKSFVRKQRKPLEWKGTARPYVEDSGSDTGGNQITLPTQADLRHIRRTLNKTYYNREEGSDESDHSSDMEAEAYEVEEEEARSLAMAKEEDAAALREEMELKRNKLLRIKALDALNARS